MELKTKILSSALTCSKSSGVEDGVWLDIYFNVDLEDKELRERDDSIIVMNPNYPNQSITQNLTVRDWEVIKSRISIYIDESIGDIMKQLEGEMR